jgi:hypothetical protein
MNQQITELLSLIKEDQHDAFLQSLPAAQAQIIKQGMSQAATASEVSQTIQLLADAVWNFLDVA